MQDLTLADLAELPQAKVLFGDVLMALRGVTIDTREDGINGKLYVAIKGERQDGHQFLEPAASKGVGGVLIEKHGMDQVRKLHDAGKLRAAVVVPNTLSAMGELARRYRTKLKAKIVAITGSNGKTSTKDFVASILSTTYQTVAARRSFNNAIGVPLTILQMTRSTQVGVLEIGMNHPGEIAALSRIADPDVVVITSIASAHVGFFRTLKQVAMAKSEILTATRSGIPAVLPADTPFSSFLIRCAARKSHSTFGVSPDADWRIGHVHPTLNHISFILTLPTKIDLVADDFSVKPPPNIPAKELRFRFPNYGEHQLTNVAASIAVAMALAVPIRNIRGAVSKLSLPSGRGEPIKVGPHLVINDSYNANPGSMSAALKRVAGLKKLLQARSAKNRYDLILVLGDMLELGSKTKYYHRLLGAEAKQLNPWRMLFVGRQGFHVKSGFIKAGGRPTDFVQVDSVEDAVPYLEGWLKSRKKIMALIKGSNQMKLEKLIEKR